MDEEEDHLSDTQLNDIFEKDKISDTQLNNIFDNYLTVSQFEEMAKDWSDVSQAEKDKKDRKRTSEDGDESPIPKKGGYLLLYILQILHSLEQEGWNLKRKRTPNRKMNSYNINMIQIKWNLKRIQ